MDITKIRTLFPVTKEAIYLNSASQSPLNTCVQNKLEAYLKTEITFEGSSGRLRKKVFFSAQRLHPAHTVSVRYLPLFEHSDSANIVYHTPIC